MKLTWRPITGAEDKLADWISRLGKSSGVYLIRSKESRAVLYVGESHSGRLRTTLMRHFQRWQDEPERKHWTYRRSGVEVAVVTMPPSSAKAAQDRFIRRYQPRDNRTGFEEPQF